MLEFGIKNNQIKRTLKLNKWSCLERAQKPQQNISVALENPNFKKYFPALGQIVRNKSVHRASTVHMQHETDLKLSLVSLGTATENS